MAHLWIRNAEEQWAVLPLDADAFTFAENPPRPVRSVRDEMASSVMLLKNAQAGAASWVLIAGAKSGVRVNGMGLLLGVRVVADRDEICVKGVGTCFFSTESLAAIRAFPGAEHQIYCPRCRQGIEKESTAVQCPQCNVWYHQSEDLPCWTYAERCALCPQTTDPEAGYRWTPEDL
ncbi:MAG: hypothetical protein M3R69_04975 [Acidobacteriota bacterium]|nr:hypothetical protein [Acidobacteriota bacterium]